MRDSTNVLYYGTIKEILQRKKIKEINENNF